MSRVKSTTIDSSVHQHITQNLRERVERRDATIAELRGKLAEANNTANVRGQVILDLRAECFAQFTTIETLTSMNVKQREALLSDATWIADAASKLRNADSVIASQAQSHAALRLADGDLISTQDSKLSSQDQAIDALRAKLAHEERISHAYCNDVEALTREVERLDALVSDLRAKQLVV